MNADVAAFQNLIANTNFDDIEIGATLDDIGFTDALIALQESAGLTVEETQRILNSLGFEPEITYVEAQVGDTDTATGLTTYTYEDELGETHTVQMRSELTQNTDGKVMIPIINGSKTTYQGSPGVATNAGNRHGGGGGCFIAGTPITTLQGYYKDIENIEIDDIVLSYNEHLQKNEYAKVLETMIHIVKEKLYNLYIEDEILTATGIHRFLIQRDGILEWIPAADICVNDLVLFANGT